jgi:large subunit ribosomal protein L22
MKATLYNHEQSPQKTRLVADLIRGKSVAEARRALAFLPKKSTPAMQKLLESAVANARNSGASADSLIVKSIAVNKGTSMRRFMPKARGRAAAFRSTRSIISLELGLAAPKKEKKAKNADK